VTGNQLAKKTLPKKFKKTRKLKTKKIVEQKNRFKIESVKDSPGDIRSPRWKGFVKKIDF